MMSQVQRTKKTHSKKLVHRLVASSSLVAGASAGLCAAGDADAAVVPFNPPGGPATIHPSTSSGPYYHEFDIDGDGYNDFDIYDIAYYGYYYLTYGTFGQEESNLVMGDGSLAAIVAPGASVGPDTTNWTSSSSLDNFLGTRGYAGVVFDIPGGSLHFGYLEFAVAADRSSATLYGGAYESEPNTPIRVPGVPEPGSLALLASGAAGLAAWRRRR